MRRLLRMPRLCPVVTSRPCSNSNEAGTRAAASGRVRPPTAERSIVAALENDPELIKLVVKRLSPESRRRLVVTGGAYEWFGHENVAQEVLKADFDQDRSISPKDFDKWFESAIRRKPTQETRGQEAPASTQDSSEGAALRRLTVPFGALVLVALEAGLPFVGFGFLDNATMILAGDAIDRTVGFYLNCSVMASAAMGNIVSGCLGMQVHGFVEKLVHRLNLPIPPLTEQQRRSQRVFLAGHIGGTLGIAIGLSLGLLPLLFIRDAEETSEQRAFTLLDANGDGSVTAEEMQAALRELGLAVPADAANQIIQKYGSEDRVNFDQFRQLCQTLRHRNSALPT